jgi:hypothetical protein
MPRRDATGRKPKPSRRNAPDDQPVRDGLLRRLGLPTCREVYETLQSDAAMTDQGKLRYIEEYNGSLKRVCTVVARERRASGDDTTDALLDVARTTVHRLRVSAVAYAENILTVAGTDPDETRLHRECLETVRGGPDCAMLWQLEEELRLRLGQPVGWTKKVFNLAQSGLHVVQNGSAIVLQTAKNVVVKVFQNMWELIAYMLPYAMRVVGWIFVNPRVALFAFITAKTMQRVMCRHLSQSYMQMAHRLPPGFFESSLATMVQNQLQHLRDYGENFGVSHAMVGMGSIIKQVLLENGAHLVDVAQGFAMSAIGYASGMSTMGSTFAAGGIKAVVALAVTPTAGVAALAVVAVVVVSTVVKGSIAVTRLFFKEFVGLATHHLNIMIFGYSSRCGVPPLLKKQSGGDGRNVPRRDGIRGQASVSLKQRPARSVPE